MALLLTTKPVKTQHRVVQTCLTEIYPKKKSVFCTIKSVKDKSINIQELKRCLLKINSKHQLHSIEIILKHANHLFEKNNKVKLMKFIDSLIDADLIEILCQLMATLDLKLLGSVVKLLNHMKVNAKFYEFHRLGQITDSLLRTLIVITKHHKKQKVTKDGIKLLISILNRNNQKYFIKHIFKQENLLNFIKKLLADGYGRKTASCYPEILTYTVLLYSVIPKIINVKQITNIICIVESSIKSLYKKIKSDHFNSNEKLSFMGLLLNTIELFLRKVIEKTDWTVLDNLHIIEIITFLATLAFNNQEHGMTSNISKCILTAYEILDIKYTNILTNHLVKEGILKFLICEREFYMNKKKDKTLKLINNLLIRQLVLLCRSKLNDERRWEQMIKYGFDRLPSSIKSWCLPIDMKNYLDKTQMAIFIFAYFYYASLPTCFESKLSHLDHLMIRIPSKMAYLNSKIDAIFIKILIFLFAVSMLLNSSDNWQTVKIYTRNLNRLKKYSDSPEICNELYTKHQDFITWIISESAKEVPLKIKYNFVINWITDKGTSNLILQSAAVKDKNVSLFLLSLLTQCKESTILPLHSILEATIESQKLLKKRLQNLKDFIWSNFIYMLDKYKNNESIAWNLMSYINLAIKDVPRTSDYNWNSIISMTISSILEHSLDDKTELHVAFLRLIIFIVSRVSSSESNSEVLMFVTNIHFLKFVKSGLLSVEKEIFLLSMKLISFLNQLCKKFGYELQLNTQIQMKSEDINSIMSKDIYRAFSGVELFCMAIPSKGLKPFFCITMLSRECVEKIYFNLLSLSNTIPDQSEKCWNGLSYILSSYDAKLMLAVSPWTLSLIEFILNRTQVTINNLSWSRFLIIWLTTLQAAAGLWPNKGLFSQNEISNVMKIISAEVIAASSITCDQEFLKISQMILNMKLFVPEEIKTKLKALKITEKL